MSEKYLLVMEDVINGDHEPEQDWWLETVKELIEEVRRLRAELNKDD